MIDSVIISLMIASVIALSGVQVPQVGGDTLSVLFSVLLCLILSIGYGTVFEASPWQATLGKRLMRLRVYDSQAGRLVLIHAAGRNLLKDGPFPAFGLIPGGQVLSLIWLGARLVVLHRSPVYQAIHDRVTHTWVAASEEVTQLHYLSARVRR